MTEGGPPSAGERWPAPDPDTVIAGPPVRIRPWWGMGDALMLIPVTLGIIVASLGLIAILAVVEGIPLDEVTDPDATRPGSVLVLPIVLQAVVWGIWPFLVSRWKGLGPGPDWGWRFTWSDLGIGLGVAMIGLFAAGVTGALVSVAVGLDDETLAENTAIVSDLDGSPWLWGMLLAVVVLIPISEELVFRGLILRSVAKRWGPTVGVIGSLLAFVPFHFADGGILGDGQIVLWASITALGLVLAITSLVTGRLGAPIVAHMLINGVGAAGALGMWDRVGLAAPF